MTLPSLLGNSMVTKRLAAEKAIKKDLNAIITAHQTPMPGNDGNALAKEFSKTFYTKSLNNNILEGTDGKIYAFKGNGQSYCKLDTTNLEANCTVTVDINGLEKGPNTVGDFSQPKDRWRYIIGEKEAINAADFFRETN